MKKSIVFLTAIMLSVSSWAEPRRKKIIATGWDTLRIQPSEVLANADKFANSGIDGINLSFSTRNKDGKKVDGLAIFSGFAMEYDDVKHFVPDFQKIAVSPGLTESLLTVWWTPRQGQRIKWSDDSGWRLVAGNMGVMAKLAKEGGLKGLFLDWEDYSNVGQFKWIEEEDPPLKETMKLARQRGREVGGAVFKEFPDLTFFSYWWLCCASHISSYQATEREYALSKSVWVAFVDGMFDVMPDGVTMIDGREHYHLESFRRDFYRNSSVIQTGCQALLSPENRAKYRRAISVSFGHYLDMYTNDESEKRWYYGPEGGSRLEHFRRNLEQSLSAATEYVWIYGEKGLFVPFEGCRNGWIARQKPWDEQLPGFQDVLRKTKALSCHVKSQPPAVEKKPASSARVSKSPAVEVKDVEGDLPRKFIAVGESLRATKPRTLIKNAAEIEKAGIDGVAVSVNATDSKGFKIGSDGIASPVKFPVSRLRPFIPELKTMTKTGGLKESLLYISWSPKKKLRLPWHSDKRWELFAYNMGMMAKLAKAVGIKGFYIDIADSNNSRQFCLTEKDKGFRYETLVREARRHGRKVGKAIFSAYPEIVLFASAWFSAENDLSTPSEKSIAEIIKERGSLWPAFVNGIIEVMPPTASFVDGSGKARRDSEKCDFHKASSDLFIASNALVEKENHDRLFSVLSAASGDELSGYEGDNTNHKFWRNLSQAAATSTRYVWIDFGDSPIAGEGVQALDARIPGWRDVVCQVKDERAWIERYLKENASSLVCVVPDPTTACGISKGYFAYIERDKREVASIVSDDTVGEGDSVSFKMTNCGMDGTLMFRAQNVKPKETYILKFSTKGYPVAAKASWREDSKFRWNIPSVGLPLSVENEAGWRTASRIIRTPDKEGYNEMYLMIDMRNCKDSDSSWVDNVYLYKIQ